MTVPFGHLELLQPAAAAHLFQSLHPLVEGVPAAGSLQALPRHAASVLTMLPEATSADTTLQHTEHQLMSARPTATILIISLTYILPVHVLLLHAALT